MKSMKKFMGAAMLAGAALAGTTGVANAEGSFSGSVTMVSDYVFRGISQSDNDAAIQGSLDYTDGIFYAGVWGSSVDFGYYEAGSMELDAYFGITPTTGPVSWDIAAIGYFYPGSADGLEFDYYELKVAPSINLTEALSVGAAVFYSPDFFGAGTDEGLYWELNAGYAFTDAFSVSAAYGVQDVEAEAPSTIDGDYSTWTVGASYSLAGFDLGLAYTTTEDADDNGYLVYEGLGEDKIVFSIGRSL
jgi:uncharacterized protein (TIGR02001 family)